MAEEEVQPLPVNPQEYVITTKTNESPMIEQLEGCVGVGLIQKNPSVIDNCVNCVTKLK
jgi:hypothetical protein